MIQQPATQPFDRLANELSAALGGWQPHSPQPKKQALTPSLLGGVISSISQHRTSQSDAVRENIHEAETTDASSAPPKPNPRLATLYQNIVAIFILSTDHIAALQPIADNHHITDPFLVWISKWARNIITSTPGLEAEDWLHCIHKISDAHSQNTLLDGYNCAIQYSRIWAAGDVPIDEAITQHTQSTVDGILRHIDKQRRLRGVPR